MDWERGCCLHYSGQPRLSRPCRSQNWVKTWALSVAEAQHKSGFKLYSSESLYAPTKALPRLSSLLQQVRGCVFGSVLGTQERARGHSAENLCYRLWLEPGTLEVPVLKETSASGVLFTHSCLVPCLALKAAPLSPTVSVLLIYFSEAPAKSLGC